MSDSDSVSDVMFSGDRSEEGRVVEIFVMWPVVNGALEPVEVIYSI